MDYRKVVECAGNKFSISIWYAKCVDILNAKLVLPNDQYLTIFLIFQHSFSSNWFSIYQNMGLSCMQNCFIEKRISAQVLKQYKITFVEIIMIIWLLRLYLLYYLRFTLPQLIFYFRQQIGISPTKLVFLIKIVRS